jgi:TPP-dependent pyruvate/acetoin dehydrogenase alpha subunit
MAEGLSRETRLALFERMLLMRRFEEMVIHMAAKHKYIGRNHLYIGHEATGAAALMQLEPGDLSYTTHRNHGHFMARGADAGKALAEIMGRAGGLNGGRGGTWHLCDTSIGFHSTSAMVGGSIGLSIGGGYALKHQKKGRVSAALFGDGTLDEGISYEALNFASVFELPVLFLCENNSKAGQRPSSMLAAKALGNVPSALNIACEIVDGADAEAVHATIKGALARIRKDGKPVFVEATLERWPGSHQLKPEFTTGITDISQAWDDSKITGQYADWTRKFDPIRRYARFLLDNKVVTKEDLLALDKRVTQQMEAARDFAEASPFPKPESAVAGAFA